MGVVVVRISLPNTHRLYINRKYEHGEIAHVDADFAVWRGLSMKG
jgi:hypothetical protein